MIDDFEKKNRRTVHAQGQAFIPNNQVDDFIPRSAVPEVYGDDPEETALLEERVAFHHPALGE